MRRSTRQLLRSSAVFTAALGASALGLFAQGTPPPQAPAAQTPAAPAPADASAGRGAQAPPAEGARGRGRGPALGEPDFSPKPPVLPLRPEEQVTRFRLPPGFKMEAVLADPHIQESAQIAFDGNGRMFVLELRGYMQDADATGELLPVGRISVHEDRDNDGQYETHQVFVDNLVFPRFVMPFGANAVLTKESNADDVWKFTDTNDDGVADKKELFTSAFGRLANVEHQESGLLWAMDNWMYSTINQFRIRWTPTGILREPTDPNGGAWGVTQDNYGKTWFQTGASGMPGYFQFPVVYGNFVNPEQFEENLNITWGAPVLVADMQGGMGSVRMPDGSLSRATGAAGNDVFRGDRLPKDMVGDYFYGETVARIVRRLRPVNMEGLTQLRNVYPLSEFIRSTDPLFRPVDMTTAPDGTMYITDMYRGIIQEAQWSGPGTYLRQKIDQYALDKIVRHGRIWRLTYEGMPRDTTRPRMLNETPAQLVAHLSHPNGWWRDTAQQLLVLRQDKSVAPALRRLVTGSANQLARLHAVWTLEGLGSVDAPLLRTLMKDSDPAIRSAAIRVSETLYKAGDRTFAADYTTLSKDADVDVALQAIMTMNVLKVADTNTVVRAVMDTNKARGIQLVAAAILKPSDRGRGSGLETLGTRTFSTAETAMLERGRTVYTELCFSCHGDTGLGEAVPGGQPGETRAPALAASPRVVGHRDYVIKTLLHGMTGPIDGQKYADVMIPMGQNSDEWIASVASYVRNSFGNSAPFVSAAEVARVRAATADRRTSWTVEEIEATIPRLLLNNGWKLDASHNPQTAANALSIQPWISGEPQAAGMWIQVELPQPVRLTEVQFDSAVSVSAPPAPGRRGEPPPANVVGAPTRSVFGGPAALPENVGYPRAFQVQVSMDGTNWSAPVAEGQGTGPNTVVGFTPVEARFVRITQTANSPGAPPLSILRLRLYEAPPAAGR